MAQTKPKAQELRRIYKKLVSPSEAGRIVALTQALHWYDGLFSSLKQKTWTDEQKQNFIVAEKIRGGLTQHLGSALREHTLKEVLQMYEQVYARLRVPKVATFYDLYGAKKDRLDHKQTRLQEKYGKVLHVLTVALSPKTLDGQPITLLAGDVDTDTVRSADLTQIVYSRFKMSQLKTVLQRRGVLPLCLGEMQNITRSAALFTDGTGQIMYDPVKHMAAVAEATKALLAYCCSPEAPHRLVRVFREAPKVTNGQPRLQNRLGSPSRFIRGEKVGGVYVKGSAAAMLYETLSDQEWHPRTQLQALISADVTGRLRCLTNDGRRLGGWAIEQKDTQARMVLKAEV